MEAEGHDTGFDAANECMVNLIEKGIIDPTKVRGGGGSLSVDPDPNLKTRIRIHPYYLF